MKRKLLKSFFTLLFLIGNKAQSESLIQTVDGLVYTGIYAISGESSTNRNVELSGFGAYMAQLQLGFKDHFRLGLGVNYLVSGGVTGDTAWGLNTTIQYFPWSLNGRHVESYDGVEVDLNDVFRPYVGLTLKNVQFTTILSTTYTGYGVNGGFHYSVFPNVYLAGEGQYNLLSGNSLNSITEINLLVGIGFSLK